MEVYIEYVILDNLIINQILLQLSNKLTKSNLPTKKLFFSAFLGTLLVLVMPLVCNNNFLLFFYRIITACLMVIVLKGFKDKSYFQFLLVFISITFLFGGFLIATLSLFDIVYTTSGLLFLNFEIPLSVFVIPIWIYSLLVNKIYHFVIARIKYNKLTYKTTIVNNNVSVDLTAFLDTGNELKDIDGSPVVVIEMKSFFKIFNNFPIHKLLLNSSCFNDLAGAHYIKVDTVNSSANMLIFIVDKLIVHKGKNDAQFTNVKVGLSRKNFADYNLILNKNFC